MRANNLPRLTSLPPHLPTWGTGSLSQVGKKDVAGDGLEVLDLGNCSLPLSAIQKVFLGKSAIGGAKFPHLRSLTLSANPLCLEAENYATQLQDSPQLPKIQIIDTKRLVERKRAGMQPETKRERKQRERAEGKRKPTGANVDSSARKMRTWGAGAEEGEKAAEERSKKERKAAEAEGGEEDEETRRIRERMERAAAEMDVDEPEEKPEEEDGGKKKRKRKRTKKAAESEPEPERPVKKLRDVPAKASAKPSAKPLPETKGKPGKPKKKGPDQAQIAAVVADPTTAKASKPSRSETAVVGVVDVKKEKKKDAEGGVDLAAMLKSDSGSGLGVGGW